MTAKVMKIRKELKKKYCETILIKKRQGISKNSICGFQIPQQRINQHTFIFDILNLALKRFFIWNFAILFINKIMCNYIRIDRLSVFSRAQNIWLNNQVIVPGYADII
jgi:hypothetical protein